jgi:hypothetical protein
LQKTPQDIVVLLNRADCDSDAFRLGGSDRRRF